MKTKTRSTNLITVFFSLVLLALPMLLQAAKPIPTTEDLPSVFLKRLKNANAGVVSALNSVAVGNAQMATPVRTFEGNLKVIVWRISDDGTITRKGDKTVYKINNQIASAHMGNGRLVTATRDLSGKLKLSVFQTYANGAIVLQGTATGGNVTHVAISSVGSTKFITSVRTSAGDLRVTGWSINNLGQISALGHYTGGKIYDVAQTQVGQRAVSAVRTASGALKLITFKIKFNGDMERQGDSGNQAGSIKDVDIVSNSSFRVITSVKQPNNTMKLISWQVKWNGDILRKETSPTVGPIISQSLAVGNTSQYSSDFYTGVRAQDGKLNLRLWDQNFSSKKIEHVFNYNYKTEAIGIVHTIFIPEKNIVITTMKTGSGALKLTSWQMDAVG